MYKSPIQRFRQIVKVLAFYGFGYLVDSKLNNEKKSPSNLRKAFEELGATFVKIGQILSTRPDILPPAYIDELVKLQDEVPGVSFQDIKTVFYHEFNKNIEDVFADFNVKPLASASIAQVHTAVFKDGTEVIVKIQRPDISEEMKTDLEILHRLAILTKARFSDALIDPKEVIEELSASTKEELNFINEGNNIDKFKELNADVAFVYAPNIYWNLTTMKVLTMERIHGFKIDNMNELTLGGYDRKDLGKKLAISYFKQIFKDGFFHGDPHPGNLLIKGGKICFIDFGIACTLTASLRDSLNDMILAVAYQDINKMISVLMAIGIKKGYVNRNVLYADIDYMFATYLSASLENIQVSLLLEEVFEIAKKNNLRLPKDLTLLIRGMVIIEGVVAKICPEIKILDVAIPFVKATSKFNPFEDFEWNELLIKSHIFLKDSVKLPSKLLELSDSLMSGRAKVQLEHTNLEKTANELNKMVNRIIFAVVVSALIMGSSNILGSNIGPRFYGMSIIGISGFGFAAVMGIWLIISILRSGKL